MDLADMILVRARQLQRQQQRETACAVRVTLMRRFCCTLTTCRVGEATLRISWRGMQFHVPCGAEGPLRTLTSHIAAAWLAELPDRVATWQADNSDTYFGGRPDPLHLDDWEAAAAATPIRRAQTLPTQPTLHTTPGPQPQWAATTLNRSTSSAGPSTSSGDPSTSSVSRPTGSVHRSTSVTLTSSSSSSNNLAHPGIHAAVPNHPTDTTNHLTDDYNHPNNYFCVLDPQDPETDPLVGDGGVSVLLCGSTRDANRVVAVCGGLVVGRARFGRPEGVADALLRVLLPLGFLEGVGEE